LHGRFAATGARFRHAWILSYYGAANCNLLVLGAYSRGHLRERIPGGVTHELLLKKDLPVFALHA
jgi:nucleotide-binding universal stress UspA family protein